MPASPTGSSSSRPGITIRDRLRVLLPEDAENYYDLRDLIPADLKGGARARAHRRSRTSTPSCSRTPRRSRASPGTPGSCSRATARTTRSRRRRRRWSAACCATSGADKQQIIVLNDEAHHCYQDKPLPDAARRLDKEAAGRERGGARLVHGPAGDRKARRDQADLRPLGDAVLPQGLRLQRGLHLPVDGQRLLADGRDRVGHRQGAAHPGRRRRRPTTLVTYLRLWDYIGDQLCRSAQPRTRSTDWLPPPGARGRAAQPAPQLREGVRALGEGARASTARRRRCSSSSARTPSSASSSTTGSPARQVERRRRDRRPQAGQPRAAQQRRRRQAAGAAAHHPDRLGAARVRRGDEGRLQAGRGRRDRRVQGRVPPPQPGRRRRQDHRRATCSAR